MTTTISHYARTAEAHRVQAMYAESVHEQMHWDAEAHRFAQLAEIETVDPAAARAAYRPTRAYDPDMPIVQHHGEGIRIVTAAHGDQTFNADRLETAWLLRLDMSTRDVTRELAYVLRSEHAYLDAISYAIAADALVRAGIDPSTEQ
ncbi:hypothetical protein [Micromonospora sediminicola]|uniref:hypothetical protein n=1 Tax=Micromonospora sediminicola TaxID=946078 RepID=UPI0037884D03